MTFFTSDQHFGHFNIIRFSHRPFATVEEMDAVMLANWNSKVKGDDTVYVLGDLFFRAAAVEPILKALNGRKHLIVGNHDGGWMGRVNLSDYFVSVQTLKEIDLDGKHLVLCHYPMLSYPQSRCGYMVYGHIHNNVGDDYWPLVARRPRMLNAGVDVNNFEPVTFEELLTNNVLFHKLNSASTRCNPFELYCAEK